MTTSCGPPSVSSASWSTRCRSSDASCTRSSTAWRPTWPPGTRWAKRDRCPRMTPDLDSRMRDLGGFIRDQRRTARLSLRKLSELAGISNPYLSQIERGLRKPSAEILQAIAKALRISAETLYVQAGILEAREDEADLVAEILRNRTINERQKQVLIEIYRSFRRSPERSEGT